MKLKKIIIIVLIAIAIININSKVFAKYVFEYTEKAAILEIDRTAPVLEIIYSTKDITSGDVEVKIVANEKIQELEGWKLLDDGKTLVKIYSKNQAEKVIIKDLSGNETDANIIVDNIDKEPPTAQIINIINTNNGYESYANKTHKITINLKVQDNKNLIEHNQNFKIFVGTKEEVYTKEIKVLEEKESYIIYEIQLTNVLENGKLTLEVLENSYQDKAGNMISKTILDTGITIDNIKPEISFQQKKLDNGKILAIINSNEKIREPNGWNISNNQDSVSKEFISDIQYVKEITDLAGNTTITNVEVKGTTYLNLECLAHISEKGWVKMQDNFVGTIDPTNLIKIESLAFKINNQIPQDILKASVFSYTYWGENSSAKSPNTGLVFNYGKNPENGYKTMANSELAIINGEQYMQLGLDGANKVELTDINGNNPIPAGIAKQYLYGISGISLELEDSENSIIYQLYFNDIGWSKIYKDGENASIANNKIIEGLRIAVVPKSEVEFVINEWSK